jgi:hypothetical protein
VAIAGGSVLYRAMSGTAARDGANLGSGVGYLSSSLALSFRFKRLQSFPSLSFVGAGQFTLSNSAGASLDVTA